MTAFYILYYHQHGCTVLYYKYCTVLYCMFCTVLYYTVHSSPLQLFLFSCPIVSETYGPMLFSTLLNSSVLYYTILRRTSLRTLLWNDCRKRPLGSISCSILRGVKPPTLEKKEVVIEKWGRDENRMTS